VCVRARVCALDTHRLWVQLSRAKLTKHSISLRVHSSGGKCEDANVFV